MPFGTNPHHPAYDLPYNPALQRRIPSSTSHCIVFPYDPKTASFQIYSYTPQHTQDRLTYEEVESFLEQVNTSLKKWHEENRLVYDPPCIFYFALVMCAFLLPLLFVFLCWFTSVQKVALKDLDESIAIAKDVIDMNNPHFESRGLRWVAPYNFPHWIELETNYRDPDLQVPNARNRMAIQGIPVRPQPKRPEIQTVQLAQQDYQAIDMPNKQGFYSPMNQNQFNGDVYNANLYDK